MTAAKQLFQYFAVLFGGAVGLSACTDVSPPPSRVPFLTCEPITQNARGDIYPVPSPDGHYVAYRAMTIESPEAGDLHYVRLDDTSESHVLLEAGEFNGGASWSPDSEWISYTVPERRDEQSIFVEYSIYKVNIRTNQRVRLVDGWTTQDIGAYTSWTAKNEIVFATEDAIYKVDAGGGTPEKILGLDMTLPDPPMHLAADPNGNSIAFSVDASESDDKALRQMSGIWLAELDAGRVVQLTNDSSDKFPAWRDAESIFFQRVTIRQGQTPSISLYSLSLLTGTIAMVGYEGIIYSIAQVPDENVLFAATAPEWDTSQNDFNIFRGFSISKCSVANDSRRSRRKE